MGYEEGVRAMVNGGCEWLLLPVGLFDSCPATLECLSIRSTSDQYLRLADWRSVDVQVIEEAMRLVSIVEQMDGSLTIIWRVLHGSQVIICWTTTVGTVFKTLLTSTPCWPRVEH